MIIRFLRFIAGIKPKQNFILGRPFPQGLKKATAIIVKHDRRLSAGIFAEPARKKGKDNVYRLAIWKSYQLPTGKWVLSTGFFPDEIDPALRLLEDCRRSMLTGSLDAQR